MTNPRHLLTIFIFLFGLRLFAQVEKKRDSLKVVLTTTVADTSKVKAYLHLIHSFFPRELDSAAHYANKMLAFSKSKEEKKSIVKSHIVLAKIDRVLKKNYAGYKHDSVAYILARQMKDTSKIRAALIGITKYYALEKDFVSAKEYGEKAVAISGSTSAIPINTQIEIALNLSYILKSLEDYGASIALLLPLTEHIDNPDVLAIRKEEIHIKLGEMYLLTEQNKKAINQFLEALKYSHPQNYALKHVQILVNLGLLYSKEKQYTLSERYNLQAYEFIHENPKHIAFKGRLKSRLGYSQYNRGNYDEALQHFKDLLAHAESISDTFLLANAYSSIGETLVKQQKFSAASAYLKKSKEIYSHQREQTDPYKLANIYQTLVAIDTLQGIFNKTTFFNQTRYAGLTDSLSKKEAQEKIKTLEVKYEAVQKDEKIKLLAAANEVQNLQLDREKDNVVKLSLIGFLLLSLGGVLLYKYRTKQRALKIINTQKLELEARNKENVLLTQEMHHRVKNNLQIIMTLLSTSYTKAGLNDSNVQEVLLESQNKIKTMALIHQDLYANKEKGAAEISANSYFGNLIDNIKESYTVIDELKVAIRHKFEDVHLPLNIGVPLGLIVNELLTNAIKYAFREQEGNEVNIAFSKAENGRELYLNISDNGKGFDTDSKKSNSFGLSMVRGLVGQLNGSLHISKHKGISYKIVIPVEMNF